MLETFTVQKKINWEMGHRLSLHKGKCHNIHGHSYIAEIVVEAQGLDGQGMVVDFYNYKPLKEWIDETLDHSFMINDADPMKNQVIELCEEYEMKLMIVNFEPTAENIAKMIAIQAVKYLNREANTEHPYIVRQVTVWETASSSATYVDRSIALGERY